MSLVDNNSLSVVPYPGQNYVTNQPGPYVQKKLKACIQSVIDSFSAYMRSLEENRYLNTYKALHLGGKETLESRMIRSAIAICPTHSESETAERFSNYSKVSPSI